MPRAKVSKKTKETNTYLDRLEEEVKSNQSRVSLILGALILLVIGILLYNYFNRGNQQVGPAQKTEEMQQQEDVSPQNLPGKYTVKEGDTLFLIAEKYYGDGFKYEEIVKANNLYDPNNIEVGKILEIPKVEGAEPSPTTSASVEPSPSEQPSPSAQLLLTPEASVSNGEKGASTDFGAAITGETYTVVEGDWLSTIAARAYGDIMAYTKIAQANNIQNPDLILPGQVLKLPR